MTWRVDAHERRRAAGLAAVAERASRRLAAAARELRRARSRSRLGVAEWEVRAVVSYLDGQTRSRLWFLTWSDDRVSSDDLPF